MALHWDEAWQLGKVLAEDETIQELITQLLRKGSRQAYLNAISNIGRYRAYTAEFLSRYDLLLSPTLAVGAFKIGHPPEAIGGKRVFSPRLGFYPFTYPFNATGNPAASIPCGFTKEGMPAGLQIIGRHEDEATVIAASAAFEQARPWAQHRPPVH